MLSPGLGADMRRREFLGVVGGVAAWPVVARAQQAKLPVIGLLSSVSFEAYSDRIAAFRQGLKQIGFVEDQNVKIEYRSADGHAERLPALAAELVRMQVSALACVGAETPALAAKAATLSIPIVFAMGADAISVGLVASLNRPEGNVTGVSFNNTALGPKRLDLVREFAPNAISIGYLVDSDLARSTGGDVRDLEAAGRAHGLQVSVLEAGTEQKINAAFNAIGQKRIDAIVVHPAASLNTKRNVIIALAARYAIPVVYPNREYVVAGGLTSYGVELLEMYRQGGVYTGRILRGAQPADLPVLQPTKFELVINLKTAKTLGLTIAPKLLFTAGEVIE